MKKNKITVKHPAKQTWAIRGIEPETRIAALMAAQQEGETVGAWCNRVLREAAVGRLKVKDVPAPTLDETLAKLAESMAQQAAANTAILARLEAVERVRDRQGMAGGGNLLTRLYGLLKGKQTASNQTA